MWVREAGIVEPEELKFDRITILSVLKEAKEYLGKQPNQGYNDPGFWLYRRIKLLVEAAEREEWGHEAVRTD